MLHRSALPYFVTERQSASLKIAASGARALLAMTRPGGFAYEGRKTCPSAAKTAGLAKRPAVFELIRKSDENIERFHSRRSEDPSASIADGGDHAIRCVRRYSSYSSALRRCRCFLRRISRQIAVRIAPRTSAAPKAAATQRRSAAVLSCWAGCTAEAR